ncbi:MAG TPA: arylesterase [Methylocystis sp.]|nr:arylesterase [Methylocystis sp.]
MSSIKGCGTSGTLVASREGAGGYRAFARVFQAAIVAAAFLGVFLGLAGCAAAKQLSILAFGDSLTAGLGLSAEDSFPAQLERRLRADGFDAKVVNAGVSGDTTAGGLARLDFSLADEPDLVILELGANDMLRGLSVGAARDNLAKMIEAMKARGAAVVLAGMQAATNFDAAYKAKFDAIYPELARKYALPLYPFFMAAVADEPALKLADGVHPNAAGVARIVAGLAPLLEENLKLLVAKTAGAGVR